MQGADLTGPSNNAGVLLRDAPAGNWIAETKLTLPLGEDTVRNYQQAGLIAYVDDDQFARLSAVAIWNTRQVEFGYEIPYAGATSYGGTIAGTPGERTTWLRLAHRTDAQWRARVPRRGQPGRPHLDVGRRVDDARGHHTADRPRRPRRRGTGRRRLVRLPEVQPMVMPA